MYTNPRPSSPPLVTYPQLKAQLRIDADDEKDYLMDLLDAATEAAEQMMDASLLTRTITATINQHDLPFTFTYDPNFCEHWHTLPRGPVQAITSAVDSAGNQVEYKWQRVGNTDRIRFTTATPAIQFPVTVTYTAGYGQNVTDIPADIRLALRTHVAALWSTREATTTDAQTAVPFSLQSFYALKRRTGQVA